MNKKAVIAIVSVACIALLFCLFFFVMNRKYTVTFEVSTGVELEKQTIKKGEHAQEPKAPTREGYNFIGWFDGNIKYDFNSEVVRDITLVARWEKKDTAKISIISSKSELNVGEELELSFKITPENSLEGKEVKWSSNNEEVATVDENGKVKALNTGNAEITVEVDGLKSVLGITVVEEETETKTENTNTSKKTNTSKNTNTNKSTNSNTNTNTNTNTNSNNNNTSNTDNNTEKPTETITYSYKWEDVGSVVGQMRLYIVSSKGEKVTATVTLTSKDGDKATETIPATGKIFNKEEIASVTNIVVK